MIPLPRVAAYDITRTIKRGVCRMHPDEVTWITENVAISNFVSAHSKETLAFHRVSAVLCLDRDLLGGPAEERGIDQLQLVHLHDGGNPAAVFAEAVAALERMLLSLSANDRRVVVHCRAGRSRSVAVVAAYLTKSRGLTAQEAIELVRSKRESAVAPDLMRLVERFEST